MSQLKTLYLVLLCLLGGGGAKAWSAEEKLFQYKTPLMGTIFSIQCYASDQALANKATEDALTKAKQLESILSSFEPESELNKLNDAPTNKAIPISKELHAALKTAIDIANNAQGSFDPTLGPSIRLWKRSRTRGELPTPEELNEAIDASGYTKLKVQEDGTVIKTVPKMRLDMGGIGKGMAMDSMATSLLNSGIRRFCISSTSDILAGDAPIGKEAWIIQHQGKDLPLKNAAISTSGDAQQHINIGGERYSHVIDAYTGLGKIRQTQTSILAPTAALADALATAYSLLTPEEGEKLLHLYQDTFKLPQTND